MRWISRGAGALGLCLWFGTIGVFYSYHDNRHPTAPDALTGNVISSNNHGSIVYITQQEDNVLWRLGGAAFFLFAIGGIIDLKYKLSNPFNLSAEQRYRILRDRMQRGGK